MGCWMGQRFDDLQLLDDRAWPPVRDDERQRILALGTHMDEVDVEAVDLGHELWQGLQFRLALAPVVICPPIAREFLNGRQLHPLRCIRDCLLLGPAGCDDASAKLGDLLRREVGAEGADGRWWRCRHDVLLWSTGSVRTRRQRSTGGLRSQ